MSDESVRRRLVFKAMLAEQMERFEEMGGCIKQLIENGYSLNEQERMLMSVAYKGVVSNVRTAWRVLTAVRDKQKYTAPEEVAAMNEYSVTLKSEIQTIVGEYLALVDTHLLPNAADATDKVFYLKFKGDCHRYLAEITQDANDISGAEEAYTTALDACSELRPYHKMHLGTILNYSVFLYEIKGDKPSAIQLAQQGLEGVDEMYRNMQEDQIKEDDAEMRDQMTMWQLMKENLELWRDESDDLAADDDDDGH